MQSATRITISILLMASTLAALHKNTAKLRRDGVLNLYPFPRVGRASQAWDLPGEDMLLEYKPSSKRQLYAFPRVGRSGVTLPKDLLRASALRNQAEREIGQEQEQVREQLLNTLMDQMLRLNRDRVYTKRESERDPGMWFGPRLGRADKSIEDYEKPRHDGDKREPEQTEIDQSEERTKRQTE